MKRVFLVAATCIGVAIAAVNVTPTPAAAAGSFHFSFGFGSPGPYYGYPYHPRPFFGAPMYRAYPPAHQVCYPVVKLRKYVRHHRVHWRKVVVTVCSWRRW